MTNLDKIIAAAQQRKGQSHLPSLQDSVLPLEKIQDREQDTRPINLKHAEALAESIAVLGLIEPLVVDQKGRLLAGGHRIAAIKLLKEQQPEKYQSHFANEQIPVRILSFDATLEPELALQIEIAENEHRRDYTPTEVRAIADRLRSSGYIDLKGRPKKGEKALMPALSVVVGKSLRTLQRYLGEEDKAETKPSKSTTSVVLLQQIIAKFYQWEKTRGNRPQENELSAKLKEIISVIQSAIEDESVE